MGGMVQEFRAVVAVGVYYRVSENLKRSAPWYPEYFNGASEVVCSEKVRFVGGAFGCPSQQAEELGRSCGAVAPSPFAQVFTEKLLTKTIYVSKPLFVCVIAGVKRRKEPPEDQPTRLCGGEAAAKARKQPAWPDRASAVDKFFGPNRVSLAETCTRRRRPRISRPRRR